MFEDFQDFSVTTQTDPHVDIRGVWSGHDESNPRPALLLLHGFPQSHHIWHRVAPQLLDTYTVVVPDLRGYGASSKPEDVASYAKSVMARDMVRVMEALLPSSPNATKSFFICGHDRGGRVAHKLCVDYPEKVQKVVLLDIAPTLAMYTQTDRRFATAYFHWFFLIQKAPLPETLILGNPQKFAELFMGGRQADGLAVFAPQNFAYYASVLAQPDAVHAMCNDYRASATLDLDEARADLAQGKHIRCPVRVHWAKHGVVEALFDAVAEWRAVTEEDFSVEGSKVESGHYIPEHASEAVVASIREFLV